MGGAYNVLNFKIKFCFLAKNRYAFCLSFKNVLS